MSDSPIPGFITKTEVADLYGRSHRSLTRDFSRAVRVGDSDVLMHLKLRTEDGEVREGTAVTLDLIQELSNKGLTPTWYIERTWAAITYPKGSKATNSHVVEPSIASVDEQRATPLKQIHVVSRLEQQIKDLKRDKEELREEMKIKNEQIRDGHKRQQDTNELIRELHRLMAHMQARLLPAPSGSAPNRTTSSHVPERAASPVQDAEFVPADRDAPKESSIELVRVAGKSAEGQSAAGAEKGSAVAPTRPSRAKPKTRSMKTRTSLRSKPRPSSRKKKATSKSQQKRNSHPTLRQRLSKFLHRELW